MKNTLILGLSLFLTSCAGGFPDFPKIQYQYFLDMACAKEDVDCNAPMQLTCLRFEILGLSPYKVKFDSARPLAECNHMSGFTDLDFKKVVTFTNEAQDWADKHKCVGM